MQASLSFPYWFRTRYLPVRGNELHNSSRVRSLLGSDDFVALSVTLYKEDDPLWPLKCLILIRHHANVQISIEYKIANNLTMTSF